MYLRVTGSDGSVSLSAPKWMSDVQIREFAEKKLPWIKANVETRKERPAAREFTSADKKKFREMCSLALQRWEPVVGKHASTFAVRDMTSRWGSCNTRTGRLCFNLKLMDMPSECLDYVVCHELCHLYVSGHGPKFWAYMDIFYPNWRAVRRELNKK